MTRPKVLFVDDEDHLRHAASQTFDLADMDVTACADAAAALTHLSPEFEGVLVTDIRMPDMDGVALLARAQAIDPDLPVILVTGHGDIDLAVSCIKTGAYDFIEKPWQAERLVTCVRRAFEQRRLTLENRRLRAEAPVAEALRHTLYGRSAVMDKLRRSISAVAAADVDVLITGATGTGKEIAARALYRESDRRGGPFVHINCAALPETMIESELFGHEAGAFPGAVRARFGKLEQARGGVLCLDEIDSLPLPLQAKLLDVLHNRRVTRLGSNDPVALDIRVIALSKTDLDEAVAAGRFRADLLYRLNVVSLELPALNARREDIPGLFTVLTAAIARKHGLDPPDVPTALLSDLSARDWIGNVRELRNVAERFVFGLSDALGDAPDAAPASLAEQMNAHEKALISAAIAAHGGQLRPAYESLGLSRKTLYDKMQKHGISRADFADDD